MGNSAPIIACPELRRLLRSFSNALSEYERIQSTKVEADLEKAAAQMEQAKQALLAHQQEHGC